MNFNMNAMLRSRPIQPVIGLNEHHSYYTMRPGQDLFVVYDENNEPSSVYAGDGTTFYGANKLRNYDGTKKEWMQFRISGGDNFELAVKGGQLFIRDANAHYQHSERVRRYEEGISRRLALIDDGIRNLLAAVEDIDNSETASLRQKGEDLKELVRLKAPKFEENSPDPIELNEKIVSQTLLSGLRFYSFPEFYLLYYCEITHPVRGLLKLGVVDRENDAREFFLIGHRNDSSWCYDNAKWDPNKSRTTGVNGNWGVSFTAEDGARVYLKVGQVTYWEEEGIKYLGQTLHSFECPIRGLGWDDTIWGGDWDDSIRGVRFIGK